MAAPYSIGPHYLCRSKVLVGSVMDFTKLPITMAPSLNRLEGIVAKRRDRPYVSGGVPIGCRSVRFLSQPAEKAMDVTSIPRQPDGPNSVGRVIGAFIVFGLVYLMIVGFPGRNDTSLRCAVGLNEYNKLKEGMSFGEIKDIIGCEGQELSRLERGNIETIMIAWPGNGDAGSRVMLSFQRNRLVTKAASGGLH